MDVNKVYKNVNKVYKTKDVLNLSICADNHLVAEHNDEIAAVKKLLLVFNPKKVFLTKIKEKCKLLYM